MLALKGQRRGEGMTRIIRLAVALGAVLVLGHRAHAEKEVPKSPKKTKLVRPAKTPSELDKAVQTTFKDNRQLQRSYHEQLLAERREAKKADKQKRVVDDVQVELGSDVPDLDYQPSRDRLKEE